MSNHDQDPIISKIEFDEKTSIPEIVEVSPKELDKQAKKDAKLSHTHKKAIDNATKRAEKAMNMSGTQIMMGKLDEENENVSKRQKTFKTIMTVAFIVLIVGVLVFTFINDFFLTEREPISFSEILSILGKNWFYLVFALVALCVCYFTKGFKLAILCKKFTGKAHLKTCLQTAILGHYYNYVTPLAVGGQPFEIYHLSKHGVHGGVAASLPIVTFFMNQFAFVCLGVASLVLLPINSFNNAEGVVHPTITVISIIGLIACLVVPAMTILFSAWPRVGAKLVKLVMFIGGKLKIVKDPKVTTFKTMKNVIGNSKCIKKFSASPLIFLSEFVISLTEQLALSSIAYFTLRFFGWDLVGVGGFIEWLMVVQLCFIIYSAVSFIPTPGNSGAADGLFYILFSVPLSAGLAFPAMMTWRIISYYSFIIIGFFFLKWRKKRDKKLAQAVIEEENK